MDIITAPLGKVFTTAIDKGAFPEEMLQAIVVIIPKPDKDPTVIRNYRPISLLNTDVKIFSKVIA